MCVAAGETYEETLQLIEDAIGFHVEGLREQGEPVPTPATRIAFVEVAA